MGPLDINDVIERATDEQLDELLSRISVEIKDRKIMKRLALKNTIILKHKEVNALGRSIYTTPEIAQLLNVKEYFVSETIREYKQNLKDNNDTK